MIELSNFPRLRPLCFGIAMLLSPMVESDIYKWTDEQGRVHFSDRPVSEDAKRVKVKPGKDGAKPHKTQVQRRQQQQRMLDVYREEREAKRAAAEKRKQELAERKANCREARLNVDRYQTARGIYDYDERGQRRYLNEQAREDYMAKLKAEVKRWCE